MGEAECSGGQALGLLGRGGALAGGQEVLDEDSPGRVHPVGGQEACRVGRTVAHDLPAPRPEQGVHGLTCQDGAGCQRPVDQAGRPLGRGDQIEHDGVEQEVEPFERDDLTEVDAPVIQGDREDIPLPGRSDLVLPALTLQLPRRDHCGSPPAARYRSSLIR